MCSFFLSFFLKFTIKTGTLGSLMSSCFYKLYFCLCKAEFKACYEGSQSLTSMFFDVLIYHLVMMKQ